MRGPEFVPWRQCRGGPGRAFFMAPIGSRHDSDAFRRMIARGGAFRFANSGNAGYRGGLKRPPARWRSARTHHAISPGRHGRELP